MINLNVNKLIEHLEDQHSEVMQHIYSLRDRMSEFASEADKIADIPNDFWRTMNVSEMNKSMVPHDFGGDSVLETSLRQAIVAEIMGYADIGLTMALPGPGLSMPPIQGIATQEQKEKIYSHFRSDTPKWGAFAISEPDVGSDATAIRTVAKECSDGFILKGEKCLITNGKRADYVIVFATIDREKGRFGIRAFYVEKNTPGFEVVRTEKSLGLRAGQISVLSFMDCHVPKENMLGFSQTGIPRRDAFSGAQGAWDFMRPVLSSAIVGSCQSAVDTLRCHIETEGGRALKSNRRSSYSEIQTRLEVMEARIEAGRQLSRYASWKYDTNQFMSKDASICKAFIAALSMTIAKEIISMIGIQAIFEKNIFAKFYRNAKAFDILEGTGDMQRIMITQIEQSTNRNLRK